ncbi:hypothetical protein FKM82_024550 [Ascaphus truei]
MGVGLALLRNRRESSFTSSEHTNPGYVSHLDYPIYVVLFLMFTCLNVVITVRGAKIPSRPTLKGNQKTNPLEKKTSHPGKYK